MTLPKRKREPSLGQVTETTKRKRGVAVACNANIRAMVLPNLMVMAPKTLVGLSAEERDSIVVTAAIDEDGKEFVVSRFGDVQWDLECIWETQNSIYSDRTIKWDQRIPRDLVVDIKSLIYVYWKNGKEGEALPAPRTVHIYAQTAQVTMREMAERGVTRFDSLERSEIVAYLEELKSSLSVGRVLARATIFELARYFRDETIFPIRFNPWGNLSLSSFLFPNGSSDGQSSGATGKTPVIPRGVQSGLFGYAEKVLSDSGEVFKARAAGALIYRAPELIEIRDAALYLIQITSGMRNSETTGIKNGAWRAETVNGHPVNWVTTFEHKGGLGLVDFLVPPEAILALEIVAKFAEPFQARLRVEADQLSASLDDAGFSGRARAQTLNRLAQLKRAKDKIFLGINKYAGDGANDTRVEVLSRSGCAFALNRLAVSAGVDWRLTNMQCRRTFAWTVANTSLGRYGLVFLKWQLKHSSIRLSELYGSNPRQDPTLYREFDDEIFRAQTDLIGTWFDEDEPLSGGAGRKILETRAIKVKDRENLLRYAADGITVRSTGHSWCMAEQDGCVGSGIYEAYRCASCKSAVIDRGQAETWQQIHLHNLALTAITDCGQAVVDRAARSVQASERVLRELGVPLLQETKAHASTKAA